MWWWDVLCCSRTVKMFAKPLSSLPGQIWQRQLQQWVFQHTLSCDIYLICKNAWVCRGTEQHGRVFMDSGALDLHVEGDGKRAGEDQWWGRPSETTSLCYTGHRQNSFSAVKEITPSCASQGTDPQKQIFGGPRWQKNQNTIISSTLPI